MTSRFVSN